MTIITGMHRNGAPCDVVLANLRAFPFVKRNWHWKGADYDIGEAVKLG